MKRKTMNTILQNSTHNLRRVLAQAAHLAALEGKEKIEPTHLFYGLTNQVEPLMMHAPFSKKTARSKTQPKKKMAKKSLALSQVSKRIILNAAALAHSYNHSYVGTEHLFMSLLESNNPKIAQIVKTNRIDAGKIRQQLDLILQSSSKIFDMLETLVPPDTEQHNHAADEGSEESKPALHRQKKVSALEYFSVNLTHADKAAKLDPVIGRAMEIERMMRILCRRTKNNPVLLGNPGVGKTAIVEGLAKKIASGDVPEPLKGKKIYNVNLTSLIAGSAFRGELEMRFKQLLEDAEKDKDAILFIDEIHNVVGAGSSNGSLDVANILKPALARGDMRCIGATTLTEYKRYIEDDPALERRFQPITVEQPSRKEAEYILSGLKGYYERFHGVDITPEAVTAAVLLSERYIPEKFLPDKAIDVLDEACAKARLEHSSGSTEREKRATKEKIIHVNTRKDYALSQKNLEIASGLHEEEQHLKEMLALLEREERPSITRESIAYIISATTGIPVTQLLEHERERLMDLENRLSRDVIGQDNAKTEVAQFLRRAKAGLVRKGRPIASFLFLGPSGVGKTELAKTLARDMFGPEGLIKLDMSEFSESFTVSRLVGSPSGYIGYKEGGKLTEAVRQKPYSLILFDEVEKAHPRILHILLQILEDGTLTDASGKRVDFSNTVLILTSNIGAKKLLSPKESIGFSVALQQNSKGSGDLKDLISEDLKEAFSPELLNRIDRTLVFSHLTEENIAGIADKQLKDLAARLSEHGVTFEWTPKATDLLSKKSFDQGQGARMVRHSLEHLVENKLAEKLLSSTGKQSQKIRMTTQGNEFVFKEA